MEFKIEYLLVLVIALVVLTDFIIKKIKKNLNQQIAQPKAF